MCQVHTGAYVSLLAPGNTHYTACHPRKTTTYILHLVPITTHTHDRLKSIGKKKQRKDKKIKERKGKERKERKRRTKKERKGKKRQEKQEKTRQEEEARKGKEKQCHTSRPYKLTKDGIGLIEGIKCIINGTGEKTQQGGEVKAVLRYLVTAIGRPTTVKTMMARPRLQSLGQDALSYTYLI